MAIPKVLILRGLAADRPTSGMEAGQQFFTTDRHTMDVATDATTRAGVVPEIDRLAAIGSVTGASDLLILHDADATGVKEKKITVEAFKTALNIPAGTADEKVAVVSGGTAGYVWGTTGSDGVVRMGSSMQWAKDPSNGYVTLDVATIDCGTF